MACNSKILFPAIYRDGQLLQCAEDVFVDCGQVKILGEKTEKAWDAVNDKFMSVTGFFLSYKGIEYGTIDISESQYFILYQEACNNNNNTFRIHVSEFAIEFV